MRASTPDSSARRNRSSNTFTRPGILSWIAAGLVFATAGLVSAHAAQPEKKLLFFSQTAGYEHPVIQRRAGNPSFAEQVLAKLGPKHALAWVFSKDGSLFSTEYLAQFDAFVFYTNGDLTGPTRDGSPSMTPAGKAALLQAVEHGKGFVGLHIASGTFRSRRAAAGRSDDIDPYIRMIGGEFIKHGKQQTARVSVADPRFPGFERLPPGYGPLEEWYTFKNHATDLHVLLVLDPAGMEGDCYQRPPFPIAWARRHGQGRVFYTGLGHREDVWLSPEFQAMLLGGINWTTGRAVADTPPTFTALTPGGNLLPVVVDPKPAATKK